MTAGLYESAASINAATRSLDTLAFNLAHTATPAFKRRMSTIESFSRQLQIAGQSVPIPIARETIDFSPGTLTPTGNTLDFAISGRGFFKIDTPKGIRYTRGGSFFPTSDGSFSDANGGRLLIQGAVPKPGDPLKIDSNGEIFQGGKATGARIPVFDFDNLELLVPESGGRYRIDPSLEKPGTGSVQSGYLEQSNVTSVDALVGLVTLNRTFEASTRAIHTLDEATQRTTNAV
jgi:flagellar basal body rod protein FlgG